MMVQWKHTIKDNEIISASAVFGIFKLIVHHHIGDKKTWFVSCLEIFVVEKLKADTLDKAKTEALQKFQNIFETALSEIRF